MYEAFLICLYINTFWKKQANYFKDALISVSTSLTPYFDPYRKRQNVRGNDDRKDECPLEFSSLTVSEFLFAVS